MLAAWGGSGSRGRAGGDGVSGNYKRDESSDSSVVVGSNYEEVASGGAESDYYDNEYNSERTDGNGSRGRIRVDGDELVDQYGYERDGYGDGESEVEQLALLHRYPSIPFNLEPSTYYLGSTVHCISR